MLDTILEKIKTNLEYKSISGKIEKCAFNEYKTFKRRRGIYVIYDNDKVIYVGKGFFKARNDSHYKKAIDEARYYPEGWIWFKNTYDYDISDWNLVIVELESEVAITYMEGAMMLDLDPLANDETFKDRLTDPAPVLY
jgi:hypothetical protein